MENGFERKPTREEMIAVFLDTVEWIQNTPALQEAANDSTHQMKLYTDKSKMVLPQNPAYAPSIYVSDRRSFAAAQRLLKIYPGERIAVLNFASTTSPGGGVTYGARTQEESLCRCSTLYPSLDSASLWNRYYGFHRKQNDFRYTDACVYIPDVTVIKTDTNIPARMNPKDWFRVDVLTCAAPNLRHDTEALSVEEQYEIHCKRARRILSVAALHGVTALVLGAFGCGASRNNPEAVARAYETVLSEFQGYFKLVEFAIFTSSEERRNYTTFAEVFAEE